MYPLRFEPIFQRYVWGGRRLGEVFNKPIGEAAAAESWEVVDHGDAQSVVREGDLAGWTLSRLIGKFGNEILGPELFSLTTADGLPDSLRARFPRREPKPLGTSASGRPDGGIAGSARFRKNGGVVCDAR